MSESKTLKDLECLNKTHDHKTRGDFCIIRKSDLKAEAVKWKENNHRDYGLIDMFIEDIEEQGFDYSSIVQSQSYHIYLLNWLLDKFFNLTEEDLSSYNSKGGKDDGK